MASVANDEWTSCWCWPADPKCSRMKVSCLSVSAWANQSGYWRSCFRGRLGNTLTQQITLEALEWISGAERFQAAREVFQMHGHGLSEKGINPQVRTGPTSYHERTMSLPAVHVHARSGVNLAELVLCVLAAWPVWFQNLEGLAFEMQLRLSWFRGFHRISSWLRRLISNWRIRCQTAPRRCLKIRMVNSQVWSCMLHLCQGGPIHFRGAVVSTCTYWDWFPEVGHVMPRGCFVDLAKVTLLWICQFVMFNCHRRLVVLQVWGYHLNLELRSREVHPTVTRCFGLSLPCAHALMTRHSSSNVWHDITVHCTFATLLSFIRVCITVCWCPLLAALLITRFAPSHCYVCLRNFFVCLRYAFFLFTTGFEKQGFCVCLRNGFVRFRYALNTACRLS